MTDREQTTFASPSPSTALREPEPTSPRTARRDQLRARLRSALRRLAGGFDALEESSPLRSFGQLARAEHKIRVGPFLVVALGVGFGLWTLRTEASTIPYPNDASVHLLTVSFALQQLKAGHLPFTGWFPYLSLGSPFLMHYQSTPAVLAAILGLAIGAAHALGFTLYFLLALWPISVYFGMRLLGWDPWPAAAAAAVSPLLTSSVGYGYEAQSYGWYGSGLWPQLWAMWVIPLAVGFAYQAICRRRHHLAAIVTAALTIAFHFLTAYWLGLVVVVLVLLRPTQVLRRLPTALVLGVGAALSTLWVTVPLLVYGKWTAENEFVVGTFWDDSWGARKVLHWLVTGGIYDSGRFPIVTIFVGIGLVVCLLRARLDERARALVAIWVMSLLLYFGRPTFRPIIDLLPGNRDLLLHRYIAAVHLSGIFLAGVGAVWAGNTLFALARAAWLRGQALRARRLSDTDASARRSARAGRHERLGSQRRLVLDLLAVAALVGALVPAWRAVAAYDYLSALSGIRAQRIADAQQGRDVQTLVAASKTLGPGRIYAGMPSNWGYNFRVGQIPVYIYLTDLGIDEVGFTLRTYALMTGPEVYFNEADLGNYELFGVKYLILPAGMSPPVSATFVEEAGSFLLYRVNTSGYFGVVDTVGPAISANAADLGHVSETYLNSTLPDKHLVPTIAYAGGRAAAPTLTSSTTPPGKAGVVDAQHLDLAHGRARATVTAFRHSVVLFKVSYDPGWTARLDGVPVATEMVAPALIGVPVSVGRHSLVLTYHGYSGYPWLFLASGLSIVCFAIAPPLYRRWRKRQARASEGTSPAETGP